VYPRVKKIKDRSRKAERKRGQEKGFGDIKRRGKGGSVQEQKNRGGGGGLEDKTP